MLRLQRVAAQVAPGVEGPDPATHRDPFALNPFGWWLGSPAALTPSQAGLELSAAAPEAEVLAEFRRTGCVVLTELLPRVLIEECAEATLRRVDEFVRRKGPTWDLVAMTEQQGEQTRALSAASGVPDGYRDDLGRFGPAQIVAHDGGYRGPYRHNIDLPLDPPLLRLATDPQLLGSARAVLGPDVAQHKVAIDVVLGSDDGSVTSVYQQ